MGGKRVDSHVETELDTSRNVLKTRVGRKIDEHRVPFASDERSSDN